MHMNYWTIIYPFLLISSAMLKKLCELFGAIMSIIFSHVSFHSHFPISHIFSSSSVKNHVLLLLYFITMVSKACLLNLLLPFFKTKSEGLLKLNCWILQVPINVWIGTLIKIINSMYAFLTNFPYFFECILLFNIYWIYFGDLVMK